MTPDITSFEDTEYRARMTPTAIKAFRKLAERWRLCDAEAATLLGVSTDCWVDIKAVRWEGILGQTHFIRISILVGIFSGLHSVFANDMADRWVRLANQGPLFTGRTPVTVMIEDGIPALLEIRQHIDALQNRF